MIYDLVIRLLLALCISILFVFMGAENFLAVLIVVFVTILLWEVYNDKIKSDY